MKEPWRQFVGDAVAGPAPLRRGDPATWRRAAARTGWSRSAAGSTTAVEEVWRIAQQGQLAGRRPPAAEPRPGPLGAGPGRAARRRPSAPGSTTEQTAEALQAQLATAERMDAVIAQTVDRLRLLDARLDETVTRAVELSVDAAGSSTPAA